MKKFIFILAILSITGCKNLGDNYNFIERAFNNPDSLEYLLNNPNLITKENIENPYEGYLIDKIRNIIIQLNNDGYYIERDETYDLTNNDKDRHDVKFVSKKDPNTRLFFTFTRYDSLGVWKFNYASELDWIKGEYPGLHTN